MGQQNIVFWRQLQNYELDIDEYLYLLNLSRTRYAKWKRKCKELRIRYDRRGHAWQNATLAWNEKFKRKRAIENIHKIAINNLRQENFTLQNNVHQNITTMVGYQPPLFSGAPGEDPEDFIRLFKRYILASRINIAAGAAQAARRAEVDGLFETCLTGDALIWYTNEIQTEITNLIIFLTIQALQL